MKKVLLTMLAAGLTAVFAAGCVHFEYEGESAPATGNAVSLVRKGRGACPAQCSAKRLGNAVAWGNYQDVSRDDLEERLLREAEDRGADTVLITADQVVPSGTVVQVDPMLRTMEAVSPNNTYSMNQLQQDFDGGYGQAELFGKNARNASANAGAIRDYTRIIRAEFLVCGKSAKTCKKAENAVAAEKTLPAKK